MDVLLPLVDISGCRGLSTLLLLALNSSSFLAWPSSCRDSLKGLLGGLSQEKKREVVPRAGVYCRGNYSSGISLFLNLNTWRQSSETS